MALLVFRGAFLNTCGPYASETDRSMVKELAKATIDKFSPTRL